MATKKTQLKPSSDAERYDLIILFCLLAFRNVNALAVKTFFQPDEYFQSLEPAWQAAFGEGSGAWITWVRTASL